MFDKQLQLHTEMISRVQVSDRIDWKQFVQFGGCPEAKSLADRIEAIDHAITAPELAKLLRVSKISIYKGCKARRIPCFRILTNVRFDPKSVADWLRRQ